MSTIAPAPAVEGKVKKPKKDKKDKQPKSKKKLLIILVLVVVVAGAAYFMLGRGGGGPAVVPPPEPGTVLTLDPVTLNLADGRYLKLGLALQFTVEGSVSGEGVPALDGAKALDLAISQLSDRPIIELNSGAAREKAKKELVKAIEKAYEETVMDVYFTEFVMQ